MIGLVACGGAPISDPTDVVTIADRASLSDQQSDCGDPVLQDQVTTGGQRVATWQPCFDASDERAAEERIVIRTDLATGGDDSVAAPNERLAEVERVACIGVPVKERQHSPFSHRRSIDKVEPMRENGQLVGVRVVFKPVRGLTADWMRRDIDCHRARLAAADGDLVVMGMDDDPTLLEQADIQVEERNGRVEVRITTLTPDQAEIALARARGEHGMQRADR
jgi:hypothetical protein